MRGFFPFAVLRVRMTSVGVDSGAGTEVPAYLRNRDLRNRDLSGLRGMRRGVRGGGWSGRRRIDGGVRKRSRFLRCATE
jgi:hypothetical protein